MTVSVREWKALVEGAIKILGEPWEAVGSGRSLYLTKGGCDGWWASHIKLYPSSVGDLVAYNAFLGRPLESLLTGDNGRTSANIKIDGTERWSSEWFTPEALAMFTLAADDQIFSKNPAPADELVDIEKSLVRWTAAGEREAIFKGANRQLLVVLRVMCASRPLEDLIEDVDWVLADRGIAVAPTISTKIGRGPSIQDFFTELRSLLVADDWAGIEQLIRSNRAELLWILGIRNTGEPEFPVRQVS